MNEKELAELDLAVAKAEGFRFMEGNNVVLSRGHDEHMAVGVYRPTRDPAEAMRLLEKYHLNLTWGWRGRKRTSVWLAGADVEDGAEGPTPAIAICRAVVALHDRH